MKKRLDGRKQLKKYAFEIHEISNFSFITQDIWIFIP